MARKAGLQGREGQTAGPHGARREDAEAQVGAAPLACARQLRRASHGDLLRHLREEGTPHAIATSGRHPEIDASLVALGVPAETIVIDRGDVLRAKPEPDLFLKAQEDLGVAIRDCYVVGDAVWDLLAARRAGMLSVGMLSGGYGWDELIAAGAFRVYRDPADLHRSLDELGIA